MPSDPRLQKLRRVSRACDFCHKRSSRCQQSPEDTSRCQNCIDFDLRCTYTRPVRKRGLKPRRDSVLPTTTSPVLHSQDPADYEEQEILEGRRNSNLDNASSQPHDGVRSVVVSDAPTPVVISSSRAESLPDQETIGALVEIYFDIVYPV